MRSQTEISKMIKKLEATADFNAEVEVVEAIVNALEWAIDATRSDGHITDYLDES